MHSSSRFGELVVKDKEVVAFTEKPQIQVGVINGGFFVFQKEFLGYLKSDDNCCLEKEPLVRLASEKKFTVYRHDGFWQSVDTYRELELLNNLWKSSNPPWKVW